MDYLFNPKPSTIMHLDLNSCFATIEQQANPLLRGKPIAVAAYTTPNGCILAPSIEAKRYGIKTGMRVKDGKLLYPKLIILPPDPWKYRYVHLKLRHLLADYTDKIVPKSIDEFVIDLEGYPVFTKGMRSVAQEIKTRIKAEIGDWLTISVGIAPNRFLAKTAAGLHKPDGLDEINKGNFREVYTHLKLTDLCGIKLRNTARLNNAGIFTVPDFYRAEIRQLKTAFSSICGYYWYLRLRGWEIDEVEFGRRSYGNSFALPKPFIGPEQLAPILQKLVEKTGTRLRRAGFWAGGVHVGVLFRDFSWWHHGHKLDKAIFASGDIYKEAFRILCLCPYQKPVREISVSCFNLLKCQEKQLNLLEDFNKKENLVAAVDKINRRYGDFVITPARMLYATDAVHDRIAFGGMEELEEFTLNN
jgi:DNA polymerase-4